MRSLELFSGCGGLAKGLEQAGFEHCAFVEFNKWACKSLRANFNPVLVHETDIRKFDFTSVGKVDVVAGGPPCQPFSLGGLSRAHEDSRDMFPEAIRAIHELRPKAFVFENVKGLLRKSFSDYFSYIILRLTYPDVGTTDGKTWREHLNELRKLDFAEYKGLKYNVQYKLVNAVDYGVPQNRERVFIVGFKNNIPAKWKWPTMSHGKRTIADAIGHLQYMRPSELPEDHKIILGARWGEAMRQIGNAVPVKLAEQMGRSIVDALGGIQVPVSRYSFHRPRTEQLRLAIEKKRGYKGAAAGKTKSAKMAATKKDGAKKPAVKRPKSVKARYGKRG